MNGKSPIISTALPFVLRLSKDERRVFQQNHFLCSPLVAVDATAAVPQTAIAVVARHGSVVHCLRGASLTWRGLIAKFQFRS